MIDLPPSSADDALDHLVNQFADPLAFLRELVQNSIDAGSAEVEVSCDFQAGPSEDAPGTFIIHVDDWGCGMDRQVIDHQLTRLFSSDKAGDRTKIGKFGIGFVSVFALGPDAVCVDTGRAGESWRVLFRKDRTFTRIRLSEPIEGTKIRVIKAMTRQQASALAQRVRQALRYHCRHVRIELRFAGEAVSGPLLLDSEIQVQERDPAMHILVGFTPPGKPDLGSFYNRGLTLLQQPSELAGVSFKVDSAALEHTLSRDAVIKDHHYHRAMATVRRLGAGPLIELLAERLERALVDHEPLERLQALQQQLAACRRRGLLPQECAQRRVARAVDGKLLTLQDCQIAAESDWLYSAAQPSPLTRKLTDDGMVVLQSGQDELARALSDGHDAPDAAAVYVLPLRRQTEDGEQKERGRALRETTLALLRGVGASVSAVELGHLQYAGAATPTPPAVAQPKAFELSLRRDSELGVELLRGRKRALVLNCDHQTVGSLLPLAGSEPELSAYTVAKLCLLGSALDAELDGQLLALALERRCRRLGS